MSNIQHIHSIGTPTFYSVFSIVILVMIIIDMLTLKKNGAHKISVKEALRWSVIWITVSMIFAGWLYCTLSTNPNFGPEVAQDKTLEFLTGYLIEKALSVDNIFVFLMIFSFFKIPQEYQHKVLLYGVFGAIIMRTIMIAIGAVLIQEFDWILYIFGLFLLYTSYKMVKPKQEEEDLSQSSILKFVKRLVKVTDKLHGEHFFIVEQGKRYATPMMLVLIMIELSDVIFAVDSIPAIFSITIDPFIVLTSNIFAILGLRAMYFLLSDIANRFHLLKYGLAIVLAFIGIKMLMIDIFHIRVLISLCVVFSVLIGSVVASLYFPGQVKQT